MLSDDLVDILAMAVLTQIEKERNWNDNLK